eukprot:UN08098
MLATQEYCVDPHHPENCWWRKLRHNELVDCVTFAVRGDWLCDQCCNHNYFVRDRCKQCRKSKNW